MVCVLFVSMKRSAVIFQLCFSGPKPEGGLLLATERGFNFTGFWTELQPKNSFVF